MNKKQIQVIFIPKITNTALNACGVTHLDLLHASGDLLTKILDKVAIYDLLNLYIVNYAFTEITRIGSDSRYGLGSKVSFLDELRIYLEKKNRGLLSTYTMKKEEYLMELAGISDKGLKIYRENSSFIMNRDYILYQNESYSRLSKLTRIDDSFISVIDDDVIIGLLTKKTNAIRIMYGLLINLLFSRSDDFTSTSCLVHNFMNFTFKTRK